MDGEDWLVPNSLVVFYSPTNLGFRKLLQSGKQTRNFVTAKLGPTKKRHTRYENKVMFLRQRGEISDTSAQVSTLSYCCVERADKNNQ